MNLVKTYLTNNPCYKANVGRVDGRYRTFQDRGPTGLMLHSVGCAQPSAQVFVDNWNKPSYTAACVHAFIDANTGVIYQCMPWNYRGWHSGKSETNNTMVGVEMCESCYIRYTKGATFEVLDAEKAKADCKRAYDAAVELFADLCKKFGLNPLTAIISHNEGGVRGIASKHVDPEHYWTRLGMPYTMDTFRQAVKAKLDGDTLDTPVTGGAAYADYESPFRVIIGAFSNPRNALAYRDGARQYYPVAYITDKNGRVLK